MKTGIQIVAQERETQLAVKGYTVERDAQLYPKGHLLRAVTALTYESPAEGVDVKILAPNWAHAIRDNYKNNKLKRLAIAGAWICAEIDRMQYINKHQQKKSMDNSFKVETIYISGPISDRENGNREEFELAKKAIQQLGHKVVIPHELIDGMDLHPERDYEKIMKIVVAHMVAECSEVVTLHDWAESPGVNREVSVARTMLIPVSPIHKYVPTVQH